MVALLEMMGPPMACTRRIHITSQLCMPCIFLPTKEYSASLLAENMVEQLDEKPPFHVWIQAVLIRSNTSVSKVKARAKVAHT